MTEYLSAEPKHTQTIHLAGANSANLKAKTWSCVLRTYNHHPATGNSSLPARPKLTQTKLNGNGRNENANFPPLKYVPNTKFSLENSELSLLSMLYLFNFSWYDC